ncbi:exosortase U [Stieleria mannarensis]|uniref:exosortase U n=1 Tax=Stieleria mannarensis TaxID=2755585 RepID=UPI0016011DB3|nr:exosortase U [Rhodopirellula sp. JC639]
MHSERSQTIASAVFWGSAFVAPMPGGAVYLSWLSEHDQYGYIFPLLISVVALVLFRWDYRLRLPTSWLSNGLVVGGLALTLFSTYRTSPWLTAVGFVLIATAWLHTHHADSVSRQRLTYLALPLVMLIRLPLNLDLAFSSTLQRFTSRVSSYLLDAFGVAHYLRGNVIELPGGTLFVEEACSGVQSLFTVLFLVCLWVVFRRRPLVSTPAYVLAGMVWAMVMNVMRITSIALAQEWYGFDLSEGPAHATLGWVCLVIAVLLTLSTDRLLNVMFYPVPPDESGHEGNPVARLWNRALMVGVEYDVDHEEVGLADLKPTTDHQHPNNQPRPEFETALVGASVLVCLLSLGLGYRVVESRFGKVAVDANRPLLWVPDEDLLSTTRYAPLVTDHQALREANSRQLGNHADVWTVVVDGMPVRLAVSQPYPEWHDMRACYEGNGWQINDWIPVWQSAQDDAAVEKDSGEEGLEVSVDQWPVSYLEMVRDTHGFGTLLFCGLTRDGELLQPPMMGLGSLFDARLRDRNSLSSKVIMLQLWTESQMPLVPDQVDKLEALFEAFRQRVRGGLTEEASGQPSGVEVVGERSEVERNRR